MREAWEGCTHHRRGHPVLPTRSLRTSHALDCYGCSCHPCAVQHAGKAEQRTHARLRPILHRARDDARQMRSLAGSEDLANASPCAPSHRGNCVCRWMRSAPGLRDDRTTDSLRTCPQASPAGDAVEGRRLGFRSRRLPPASRIYIKHIMRRSIRKSSARKDLRQIRFAAQCPN